MQELVSLKKLGQHILNYNHISMREIHKVGT